MKIIGIGTDLVDIRRVKTSIDKYKMQFLEKIFNQTEIKLMEKKNFDPSFIAKRWAAKESTIKAMNATVTWHDIELTNEATGKPILTIHSHPNLITFVTLTDEYPYAQSYVIVATENP